MCANAGSHVGWEYLLVFEILLKGDASSHDGCKLHVVHGIGAGVFGQVFLENLAPNPPKPSDQPCDGCGVKERFHELVVRHCGVYLGFQFRYCYCTSDTQSFHTRIPVGVVKRNK